MLLRQVDRWIGLTKSLAKRLPDKRDPDKIEHSLEGMLRQRIYGLALGYEDLNDHDTLRKDLLWQTASERTEELASCSTLCRLENRAGRKEAWLMQEVRLEQFVTSFYYDFCFLPLYVFCGEQLLVSYLGESNTDSAKHAWAILAWLVKALRWPRHPKNNGGLAAVSSDAAPAAFTSPLFGKSLTDQHQTRIPFAQTTP